MTNTINFNAQKHGELGFTLIELSIVLVIIGLIIGGILVGQDLIRAAEVRATITQIQKYNSAVNTFRNKYNGIPGDLSSASATTFGMGVLTTSPGTQGQGDGNGLIEAPTAQDKASFFGEPALFFYHLSQAGYIDGGFSSTSGTNGMATLSLTTAGNVTCTSSYQCNAYMPPAKLGRSNSITVAAVNGLNYWFISGWNNIALGIYSTSANTNNLTPNEALNMDKKTDDGIASSGSIIAFNSIGAFTYANIATSAIAGVTPSAGTNLAPLTGCSSTGGVYNTLTTTGDKMGTSTTGCSLRLSLN